VLVNANIDFSASQRLMLLMLVKQK